ncbi:unnamed protein product [Didymodactylos carnosus]|uniref:3'-5' exonuclease domain-containing protein n=1 Tax=Didymodactylos carnosus TaxID=1234261 RepID=A0A814CVY9_9BILA|nr:unnamed protein product [Didymodactylos carnosus]CAF3722776.1 unnamed protein product [Didymodactylos carnosus]
MHRKRSHFLAFRACDEYKKKDIIKSQLNFTQKINNDPAIPFLPSIKVKPNAMVPLSDLFTSTEIIEQIQCGQISLNEIKKKYSDLLKNAYYYELESFKVPPQQFELCEEQTPKSLQDTKYEYVDAGEKLKNMVDHIQLQSEIAVDLEAHQHRSYYGFTCLVQISSRTADYVIDALTLRDELHILNNVFTNVNIVKALSL